VKGIIIIAMCLMLTGCSYFDCLGGLDLSCEQGKKDRDK